MYDLLAKYLHQYKQLHLPGIGSFEVVEQPARLEYADRLIYPPHAEIRYSETGTLNEAQLDFLEEELGVNRYMVERQLLQFVQDFKQKLHVQSFTWHGLGNLSFRQNRLEFQPEQLSNLTPIEAHKVIRENAQHTVLIGEQEVQSGDVPGYLHGAGRKRSIFVLIGWILLALAILFLVYYFYTKGLKPESSGSQVKAVSTLFVQPVWNH